MATVTLTNGFIAKTLKGNRSVRQTIRDAGLPGLRLVVGPQRAAFAYAYTLRGPAGRKDREIRIGLLPEISLADARKEGERIKGMVAAGRDPAGERDAARASAANAVTLAEAAAAWQPHGRPGHVANERANARLAIAEMGLGENAPDTVTRQDLSRLVEMHRGTAVVARQRLGALRRLYDHLAMAGVVETNPVRALPSRLVPKPPAARTTVPDAAQAQAVWRAAASFSEARRDFLRCLLLLPLRRGELGELRAGEVDLRRKVIALRPSRTKSGRPFEMPLSPQALAILEPCLAGLAPDARVFPQSS